MEKINNFYYYYDSKYDDLTIVSKKSSKHYSEEIYNNIYIYLEEDTDKVVGVQIMYYKQRSPKVLMKYVPKEIYDLLEKISLD